MSYMQFLMDQKEPLSEQQKLDLRGYLEVLKDDCQTYGETDEDAERIAAIQVNLGHE